MSVREIPKIPEVPPLTGELVGYLSELCFRNNSDTIPLVDLIFVFGTAICFDELAEALKKVIDRSKLILFTGGVERYLDSIVNELPESEMLYERIKQAIPKETKVLLETKSRNTFENLELGLQMLEEIPKSVCFIVKSFHSGRAYMTLKRFLPNAKIYQDSFDPIYPNCKAHMTKDTWHLDDEYRARVWGEYLRIKKYGERGNLDYSESGDLLKKIGETH